MWSDEDQMEIWKAGQTVPAGVYRRIDDRRQRQVTLKQEGALPASYDGKIAWYALVARLTLQSEDGRYPSS